MTETFDELERALGRLGLPDQIEVADARKDARQSLAYKPLALGDDDPDRTSVGRSRRVGPDLWQLPPGPRPERNHLGGITTNRNRHF